MTFTVQLKDKIEDHPYPPGTRRLAWDNGKVITAVFDGEDWLPEWTP